jgi:hypothetical protein
MMFCGFFFFSSVQVHQISTYKELDKEFFKEKAFQFLVISRFKVIFILISFKSIFKISVSNTFFYFLNI